MTTAHRPTFDPARGKEAQRGPAYHQRLLPAHTLLKQRKAGQGGIGGLPQPKSDAEAQTRDLRAELLKAEAAVKARKNGGALEDNERVGEKRKRSTSPEDVVEASKSDSHDDEEAQRRQKILEEAHDEDAESSSSSDAESDEDSDEDEDDEDEEAELLRELSKIKAERAVQRAAEEQAKAAKEAEQHEFDIARGNPLLNPEGSSSGGQQDFGIKRRWDDDVVFKNQARGTEEKGKKREFVNDLLRSDFHKRFMTRYVR